VPVFIADLARVLQPGGELLVIGPDVHRAIQRYCQGTEPWEIVIATLEHVTNLGFTHGGEAQWPNARHHWNCDEERLFAVLDQSGCFTTVERVPVADRIYDRDGYPPFPVVGWAPWQCGCICVK
jgi:hypothetical protein